MANAAHRAASAGLSSVPASCAVTYRSMRTWPVMRSTSTAQMSKANWKLAGVVFNPVVVVGRFELRRRPGRGLAHARRRAFEQQAGRPVRCGGEPRKRQRRFRRLAREDPAAVKDHIVFVTTELCGSDSHQFVASCRLPDARCPHRRRRNGSNNCPRPPTRASLRVSSSTSTVMSSGLRPNTSATTCDSTGTRPCPCGTDATLTVTEPSRSMLTVALVMPCSAAFARLFGHHGGDVAHVRNRRLDDGGIADAVQVLPGARRVAFFQ